MCNIHEKYDEVAEVPGQQKKPPELRFRGRCKQAQVAIFRYSEGVRFLQRRNTWEK